MSKNGTFSCAVIKYSSKGKQPSSPSFFSLYLLHNTSLLTIHHNFLYSTLPNASKSRLELAPRLGVHHFIDVSTSRTTGIIIITQKDE